MKNRDVMLSVSGLRVSYFQNRKKSNILNGISFDLKRGELLTVLGESGSGKSTIAKAITGLLPPSARLSGEMSIDDETALSLSDATASDWRSIRGKKVAMIFQDARQSLNPAVKIKRQFAEMLVYHRLGSREGVTKIILETLKALHFNDPERVLDSYPFQLSGGMCQRVCIAMSICLQPLLLIADEPTSALDTVSQREVLALLEEIKRGFGQSILFITHDIAVASAVSDRVVVLNKGSITEAETPERLFSNPKHSYTKSLIDARNFPCIHQDRPAPALAAPVLQIRDLGKCFSPDTPVLKNVNISLYQREILGILGQSGCGKSTLSRCIVGLEKAQRGEILYDGMNVLGLRGRRRRELCKHIQLIFQDARASLNPGYTAMQIVLEPLRYLKIVPARQRQELARSYLGEVGIDGDTQNRRPPQLSTGQCQRVAIARALIVKPDALICDEAVSALDMSLQGQILELLLRLHERFGFGILMISHDIRVLRSFCHRIAVMQAGEFCEICGGGSELKESTHPYTQLLLSCEKELEESYYSKINLMAD
jgi:peptide/nickel transport system ATP-binding protein